MFRIVNSSHSASHIPSRSIGKGNDQVRFELSVYALAPTIQIIAPWRDGPFTERFKGRNDLLKYAAENNIQVEATTAKPWSMDENLFHCSYEAGVLENAARPYPAGMCKLTKAVRDTPDEPQLVDIYFKSGAPGIYLFIYLFLCFCDSVFKRDLILFDSIRFDMI